MTEKKSAKKLFIKISITTLALAGSAAAVSALAGPNWRTSATAGVIFILNLLVLTSFTSAERWVRYALWGFGFAASLFSILFIWWESNAPRTHYAADGMTVIAREPHQILEDWTLGLWWVVVALVLLSFFTKTLKHIKPTPWLNRTYRFTQTVTLLAGTLTWVSNGLYLKNDKWFAPAINMLSILGLTAALIVTISAFTKRNETKPASPNLPIRTPERNELQDLVKETLKEILQDEQWRNEVKDLLKVTRPPGEAQTRPEDLNPPEESKSSPGES